MLESPRLTGAIILVSVGVAMVFVACRSSVRHRRRVLQRYGHWGCCCPCPKRCLLILQASLKPILLLKYPYPFKRLPILLKGFLPCFQASYPFVKICLSFLRLPILKGFCKGFLSFFKESYPFCSRIPILFKRLPILFKGFLSFLKGVLKASI